MKVLPPDCVEHVLSFLSLSDCLSYSSTSLSSLTNAAGALRHRRRSSFSLRHEYRLLPPPDGLTTGSNEIRYELRVCSGTIECSGPEEPANIVAHNCWHQIPSVHERISGLYRNMPNEHWLRSQVRDLLVEISNQSITENDTDEFHNPGGSSMAFATALIQHQKLLRPFRMHAELVAHVAKPQGDGELPHAWRVSERETNMGIRLDRYIGDVLIAACLMGHSKSGIVEGSLSESQWHERLKDGLELGRCNHQDGDRSSGSYASRQCLNCFESAPTRPWYYVLMYLHSVVLRSQPFAYNSQDKMGLCLGRCVRRVRWDSIIGGRDPEIVDVSFPHIPFVADCKSFLSLFCNPSGVFWSTTDSNYAASIRYNVLVHQFGPLGPSFRGRDRVNVLSSELAGLIYTIHSADNFLSAPKTQMLLREGAGEIFEGECTTPFNLGNTQTFMKPYLLGTAPTPQWIRRTHQECSLNRPMTVENPTYFVRKSHPQHVQNTAISHLLNPR